MLDRAGQRAFRALIDWKDSETILVFYFFFIFISRRSSTFIVYKIALQTLIYSLRISLSNTIRDLQIDE